ncbi:MAG: hypothetical protein ACREJ2_03025 [Planctomycetota bacterium]
MRTRRNNCAPAGRLALLAGLVLAAAAAASAAPLAAHEHHAPHHGTLVVLDDDFAHVEIVVDKKTGAITAYVLDGEAENSVRIKQKTLTIHASVPAAPGGGTKEITVTLNAVASDLTGETVGDSSEFSGQADDFKGLDSWDGSIAAIDVNGSSFKDVKFNFPKGNEEAEEPPKQ